MVPTNLPLLLADATESQKQSLEAVWSHPDNLHANLVELGKHWKLRVTFSTPVTVISIPRWVTVSSEPGHIHRERPSGYQKVTEHVFPQLFMHGTTLCYLPKRKGRNGYPFPSLETVVSYEPVIENARKTAFGSYEEFRKKFNPLFISDAACLELWNSNSAQHGCKYEPADFHGLGPVGKQVLKRFLMSFKGVTNTDYNDYRLSSVFEPNKVWVLDANHYSNRHPGRDIRISHQSNLEMVHYASEFHGCGNGRYGLIANMSEFLWLEDD